MKKILIVDDELEHARFIADAMNHLGINSLIATSAKKCLELLRSHQFHCVITDIVMPEMDGIELLQKVADRNKSVPIILMSGYDTHYLGVASKIGVSKGLAIIGALGKPVRLAQLESILKENASKIS